MLWLGAGGWVSSGCENRNGEVVVVVVVGRCGGGGNEGGGYVAVVRGDMLCGSGEGEGGFCGGRERGGYVMVVRVCEGGEGMWWW